MLLCVIQQWRLSDVRVELSSVNSTLSDRIHNVSKMPGPPVCKLMFHGT